MALMHAALAGGIASFQQHHDAPARVLQPVREMLQFELQRLEPLLVSRLFHVRLAAGCVN